MFLVPKLYTDDDHPSEREYLAKYKAYFFGQFRFLHYDQPFDNTIWRRNKAKSLFKWFLLNPNKLFSSDQLIDLFWPEVQPESALRNLHVTVFYLRHMLEPDLLPRQSSSFLHRSKQNFYWFQQDATWWTDVSSVLHLYDTANEFDRLHEYEKAMFRFRKIVSYCSQDFLSEDRTEEAFHPYRQQYEQIHSQALLRLIHFYLAQQAMEEVLEYAYQALCLDRYCEPAIKAIAQVYYQKGNVATAIDKLNGFQVLIRQELGVEPSKDLYTLREAIEKGLRLA